MKPAMKFAVTLELEMTPEQVKALTEKLGVETQDIPDEIKWWLGDDIMQTTNLGKFVTAVGATVIRRRARRNRSW